METELNRFFVKHLIPPVVVLMVGVFLVHAGMHMPRPMGWASSPGLFPVIIGSVLSLLACALFLESYFLMQREDKGRPGEVGPNQFLPPITVIVSLGLYILALNLFPFEPTTFLFLCFLMFLFGQRSLWKISLSAGLFVLVVTLIFTQVIQTLLPGTYSVLDYFIGG